MGCLTNIKDCKPPSGGGTGISILDQKIEEVKKLSVKSVEEFFSKIGKDIEHLPEDVKKGIKDVSDEFSRVGINFNELIAERLLNIKENLRQAKTPEEIAKEEALTVATNYKARPDSKPEKCSAAVLSALLSLGALTGGPAGEYMGNPETAQPTAEWACSQVNK